MLFIRHIRTCHRYRPAHQVNLLPSQQIDNGSPQSRCHRDHHGWSYMLGKCCNQPLNLVRCNPANPTFRFNLHEKGGNLVNQVILFLRQSQTGS